jgi:hypothetical protein
MYALGLEIRKDRREKKYSMRSCYSCGKVIWVVKENLRVDNRCSTCE